MKKKSCNLAHLYTKYFPNSHLACPERSFWITVPFHPCNMAMHIPLVECLPDDVFINLTQMWKSPLTSLKSYLNPFVSWPTIQTMQNMQWSSLALKCTQFAWGSVESKLFKKCFISFCSLMSINFYVWIYLLYLSMFQKSPLFKRTESAHWEKPSWKASITVCSNQRGSHQFIT